MVQALIDQLDADSLSEELGAALGPLLEHCLLLAVNNPRAFQSTAEDASGVLYWIGKKLARCARRVESDGELKVILS